MTPGAKRQARYRERHPEYDRGHPRNARRVFVGRYYVGLAPTPEQAATLNEQSRKEFHDR